MASVLALCGCVQLSSMANNQWQLSSMAYGIINVGGWRPANGQLVANGIYLSVLNGCVWSISANLGLWLICQYHLANQLYDYNGNNVYGGYQCVAMCGGQKMAGSALAIISRGALSSASAAAGLSAATWLSANQCIMLWFVAIMAISISQKISAIMDNVMSAESM